ncbi:hypothetical protein GQ53DRAFT_749032 [Thozetella sp. PMI_491]|nr:hypothetical protein GQ53DRAFT_749032 [Thozetella sp. PMI_491]
MAQFARARWRLAVMIPSWGLLMAILLGSMGIFAYRLAETLEHYKERDDGGQVPIIEVVWEATNIGFSVASLILTIVEISKYAAETLTPFFLLSSNVIKITLAVAELALDIIVYQMQTERNYSIVGLALDCGILATAIGTFVYALLTFRRLLKYDDYDVTEDNAHFNANHMEMGNTIQISGGGKRPRSYSNASVVEGNPSTSYESQTTGIKRQLDQAMGAEFGWGAQKSPDLVSGEVHHGKVVPGNSRHQSWISERVGDKSGLSPYDDDDLETIRMSHDVPRHDSVPTVIVSGHAEDEEDSRALLAPDGDHHDGAADSSVPVPRYHDHPSSS